MALIPLLPLVGVIHKIIKLEAFQVADVPEAIALGNYTHYEKAIPKQFARKGPLILPKPVEVCLIRFDRATFFGEPVAWMSRNDLVPITDIHLYGIGIQHPSERYDIYALGTQRRSRNLVILTYDEHRKLVRGWTNVNIMYPAETIFGAVDRYGR